MPRSVAAYLWDVRAACDHIREVTGDLDEAGYQANETIRKAVERDFQIIGDALMEVRDRDPIRFARIDHGEKIIGFRHELVHRYFDLDRKTVWDTISHDTEHLRNQIDALLHEFNA